MNSSLYCTVTSTNEHKADKLNLNAISHEFVCTSDQRSNFFGNYVRIDLSCSQNFVATSLYPTDYFYTAR